MKKYRVTGARPVLDVEPGDVLEHDLDAATEADLVGSGRLTIEPRSYQVVGTSRVHDTEPGGVFSMALPLPQEMALIEGGHIEVIADVAKMPRSELDKLAAAAGVMEPGKLPNKEAVAHAITAASNDDETKE